MESIKSEKDDLSGCTEYIQESVCRLCLVAKFDRFQNLEGETLNALKFLIPNIELNVSVNSTICSECSFRLKNSFDFKSQCMCKLEPDPALEIETSTDTSSICNTVKEDNSSRCSSCRIKLDDENEVGSKKQNLLSKIRDTYLPDVHPTRLTDPCPKCWKSLKDLFQFYNFCLDTDAKIRDYCSVKQISDYKTVDLREASSYILETTTAVKDEGVITKTPEIKKELKEDPFEDDVFEETEEKEEKKVITTSPEVEPSKTTEATTVSESPSSEPPSGQIPLRKSIVNKFYSLLQKSAALTESSNGVETFNYRKNPRGETGGMKTRFTTHKKTDSSTKLFRCVKCPFTSYTKDSLEKHLLIHRTLPQSSSSKTSKRHLSINPKFTVKPPPKPKPKPKPPKLRSKLQLKVNKTVEQLSKERDSKFQIVECDSCQPQKGRPNRIRLSWPKRDVAFSIDSTPKNS